MPKRTTFQPTVYILASDRNGTLYTGVTSNLVQRVWQHRHGVTGGFTSRYQVHKLVHYEIFERMEDAIERERRLKGWHRAWKVELVELDNPDWRDLWPDICGEELNSEVKIYSWIPAEYAGMTMSGPIAQHIGLFLWLPPTF